MAVVVCHALDISEHDMSSMLYMTMEYLTGNQVCGIYDIYVVLICQNIIPY